MKKIINKKIIIFSILIIVWMFIIFLFSNMNTMESNSKSKSIVNNVIETTDKITNASEETIKRHHSNEYMERSNLIFRKISHAFVFLVLSILWMFLLTNIWKSKEIKNAFFSLFFCLLYALFDEYHQTFVLGRTGQFTDILIDLSGSFFGVFLFLLFYRRCQVKRNT